MAPWAADEGIDLPELIMDRLAAGDRLVARRLGWALSLINHPLTAPLVGGTVFGFSRLSPDAQQSAMTRWERSRIGLRRRMYQAFRRLILTVGYSDRRSSKAIGFEGPFHLRKPKVAWEGPLPATNDKNPNGTIARGQVSDPGDEPEVPDGVTQGRSLREETTVRAGVCVIGTGAGGAVVAARLAEAGHDVILLEEGGYWTAADFTEREDEMVPRLYAEGGTRGTTDLSISILQGRAVGGGTTVGWMVMLRTPDRVLEEWALRHGTQGMSPADMAPIFELIERETHSGTLPDEAHSPQNRLILDGARQLGWSAFGATLNARDCVRAGFCGMGCRYNAKKGALLTFIPRALAVGARLYSDVRVNRIDVVERGGPAPLKLVRARVLDRATGRLRGRLTVEAPIVVLAAGAVGTPAVLERSGLKAGGIGKYLRLHPTSFVIGRHRQKVYGSAGVPSSSVCDHFLDGDGDGYGFWIESPPLYPAMTAVAIPGFGGGHREFLRAFPNLAALLVQVRDGRGPESSGEVSVSRKGRPRIRYRLRDDDRRQLLAGLKAAARLQFVGGAEEVFTLHTHGHPITTESAIDQFDLWPSGPNQLGLFSSHVTGTCRIGTDPKTSGCLPDGQVHGIRGLYVADGSLLPTAPAVNPQETIMAVATVIARGIDAKYRSG